MELYKEARLEGDSEGFDGETIFELTNGERWEQVEYYYRYRYKYRPTVKIYKDSMSYYLELEGIERKVRVRRI
ncbi:hypothetical protein [Paenisporosarcina cavernae]|uniref:Uncharacterized protein n=1 Tax=Paenisporosarcina cavernae TaxID=2320858 RepID=A0A385YST6_9BACL|nr:hypothetical protein [Paenisporosarcina cavernae]AYC28712.1 hypothetical protein D3873_02055 [Paenisporosarcina cavernae]